MHGHDYGRIRQWGSLAWLLASISGGAILSRLPIESLPPILAMLSALAVFAGLALPDDRSGVSAKPVDTTAGEAPGVGLFALFCTGIACLQGAHTLDEG